MYEADNQLGIWVNTQRQFYRNEALSVDRIERLESIGFVWDVLDMQWMKNYNQLLVYKKQHKSTQVLHSYTSAEKKVPRLYNWVINQRFLYKNGKLLETRVEYLNSIDFEWEAENSFCTKLKMKMIMIIIAVVCNNQPKLTTKTTTERKHIR